MDGVRQLAQRVLGSREAAERWLQEPAIGLDGRRPIDLPETADGLQFVEDYLGRLSRFQIE